MNGKERAKFLRSGTWKKFREDVIKKYDCKCCLCQVKTKRPKIHHMDQNKANYENLNIENFRLLCKACHDWITAMENRKYVPTRVKEILDDFIL